MLAVIIGLLVPVSEIRIGDSPPPLSVQAFKDPDAFRKFEKDKVYVIDFWATWCAACLEELPRLSEVADRFQGRVQFLSINTWDEKDVGSSKPDTREQQVRRIARFVKNAESMMRYPVAIDDEYSTTGNSWVRASGNSGLPLCFVVDQDSKIVWFGSSRDLGDVLPKVIKRSWDATKFAASVETQRSLTLTLEKARAKVTEAVDSRGLELIESSLQIAGRIDVGLSTFAMDRALVISPVYGFEVLSFLLPKVEDMPPFMWNHQLSKTVSKSKDAKLTLRCLETAKKATALATEEQLPLALAYHAKVEINAKQFRTAQEKLNMARQKLKAAHLKNPESVLEVIRRFEREIL